MTSKPDLAPRVEMYINSILDEMKGQNLFPRIYINQIRMYLYMAHGIGFNMGKELKSSAKSIIRMDLDGSNPKEFPSAVFAEKKTGVLRHKITAVCRGEAHSAGKYLWMYNT